MEELLVVILQAIFEIGAEVLFSTSWDIFTYDSEKAEGNLTLPKCFLLFLVGIGAGAFSLHFLPQVLIAYPKVRMFNLIAGPFASGYLSLRLARRRRLRDDDVVPRRHFWYSFSACLGVVMFRFAFGAR